MAGPGLIVAGAIGRGLTAGLGLGVGLAVGLGIGLGVGLASPALLGPAVGLGVAELEQATTASSRNKIKPIGVRRPVRTLSTPIIDIEVASLTPHPPLFLLRRAAAVAIDITWFKVIRA